MIVAVFVGFLSLFVIIGIAASRKAQNKAGDYFLAGRSIAPWLTALSASSTSNSGFMFIGLIGYTYAVGVASLWMQTGFILGDYLMSRRVYPALRIRSEERGALSYAGMLARWNGDEIKILRLAVAVLSLIFLALYAAAQFRAGSKALTVLFAWPETSGIILGTMIVFAYCIFGGMRASIWTDAAQAIVMILAMGVLAIAGLVAAGGPLGLVGMLPANHMDIFPAGMQFGMVGGPVLFLLGWVAGGIGYIGQPHIMVRYMTMRDAGEMKQVRLYYYSWNILFSIFAILCGLAARALLPDVALFDPELAMPRLAEAILPGLFVGFILSGLFAATISTADSQIISCATVLAHDLAPQKRRNSILFARLGTCAITLVAFLIALAGPGSVFSLVLIAWAGMGACFGPILLVLTFGGRLTGPVSLAMMGGGMAGIMLWRQTGLEGEIYELLPGLLTGLAVYGIWRLLQAERCAGKSPLASRP